MPESHRYATVKIESTNSLLDEVRSCTLCANQLEHGVRPVLQINPSARVLIAGQAPGSKVHATGIAFNDPSGERLRDWMGIDRKTFYNDSIIAIVPMGFCYPGKGNSGDLPPLPVCAQTWRIKVLASMPNISLTLAIGQYAQAWHIKQAGKNLTETVRAWKSQGADIMPLPHPSPRNNRWLKKNPWFEVEVLPALKQRVYRALYGKERGN